MRTNKIKELNKTKPCSETLVHPGWTELLALLGQYGIGGMESVGLMDTSHDEKDIRWNYLVDKRYALRLTNASEMTEARLEDLIRLIARYGEFGLRCPAFLRGKDGRFFHSWGELTVYLSEYVDLPVAEEADLSKAEQDALRDEVVLSLGRFMERYKDVDLIPIMGMYSLFDLCPYDVPAGVDEKQQNLNALCAALRGMGEEDLARRLAAKNESVRGRLLPIYRSLPRCVTQGDENFSNVLLDESHHLAGLIDFNLSGTDVCANLIANNADFNLDILHDDPVDPSAALEKALTSYRKNAAMLLTVYHATAAERAALIDYAWITLAAQWPYACAYMDRLKKDDARPSTLALLDEIARLDMNRLTV
jgi:hypothetical protein